MPRRDPDAAPGAIATDTASAPWTSRRSARGGRRPARADRAARAAARRARARYRPRPRRLGCSQTPRQQEPGLVRALSGKAACIAELERARHEVTEERVDAQGTTDRPAHVLRRVERG